MYSFKLSQFSLYLKEFDNFTNFYAVLFILVKGGVVATKVKFIIIEFVGMLNSRFSFYLLTNITYI